MRYKFSSYYKDKYILRIILHSSNWRLLRSIWSRSWAWSRCQPNLDGAGIGTETDFRSRSCFKEVAAPQTLVKINSATRSQIIYVIHLTCGFNELTSEENLNPFLKRSIFSTICSNVLERILGLRCFNWEKNLRAEWRWKNRISIKIKETVKYKLFR